MVNLQTMAALFSASMDKSEAKRHLLIHRMRFVALFQPRFWA
jgi:hypothetical protein